MSEELRIGMMIAIAAWSVVSFVAGLTWGLGSKSGETETN